MTVSRLNGWFTSRNGPLRVIGFGDDVTAGDSSMSSNGLWHMGNSYWENMIRYNQPGGLEFTFVRNAGVVGDNTQGMLLRIQSDVLDYKPDVVFLMAGTNDVVVNMTHGQYVTFFSTLEKIIVLLQQNGIDVVLATMPAKTGCNVEARTAIPWYYLLAEYYNLPLIDAFRATVDAHTGGYHASFSDDGVLPNVAGTSAITAAGVTMLNNGLRLAYRASVSESAPAQMANIIRNGTFANMTVPPNPDYWTINTTGSSFSLMADPVAYDNPSPLHYAGNALTYSKALPTGSNALVGFPTAGGFSDGDTLVFSGQVSAIGLSNPNGFSLILDLNGDTVQPITLHKYNNDFLFSQEFVVPPGFGSNAISTQLYTQDNGTYVVKELTLWNRSLYESQWSPGNLLKS